MTWHREPLPSSSPICASAPRQGRSGLGLEAQRETVRQFVASRGGRIIAPEYVEVETGKRNDRPELVKALKRCRATGATLVVAKLDRLSRNAAFLMTLRDSGVQFVAADLPEANTMTVGVMAVVAQHEREAISARTKAALAAAKRRGVKLGGPRPGAPSIRRYQKLGVAAAQAKAAERLTGRCRRSPGTGRRGSVAQRHGAAAQRGGREDRAGRSGRQRPCGGRSCESDGRSATRQSERRGRFWLPCQRRPASCAPRATACRRRPARMTTGARRARGRVSSLLVRAGSPDSQAGTGAQRASPTPGRGAAMRRAIHSNLRLPRGGAFKTSGNLSLTIDTRVALRPGGTANGRGRYSSSAYSLAGYGSP